MTGIWGHSTLFSVLSFSFAIVTAGLRAAHARIRIVRSPRPAIPDKKFDTHPRRAAKLTRVPPGVLVNLRCGARFLALEGLPHYGRLTSRGTVTAKVGLFGTSVMGITILSP